MSSLVKICKRFVSREEGATMIEYGLLAALVSIAALSALQVLGPALQTIFNNVATAITSA